MWPTLLRRAVILISYFLPLLNMSSVEFGIPHKNFKSVINSTTVRAAVWDRFPAWADQCQPYVNVLTLKAWNQRGYRVKKGEKGIAIVTMVPVWKEDKEKGEKVQIGARPQTVYVFALPQVEKRN